MSQIIEVNETMIEKLKSAMQFDPNDEDQEQAVYNAVDLVGETRATAHRAYHLLCTKGVELCRSCSDYTPDFVLAALDTSEAFAEDVIKQVSNWFKKHC